MATVFLRDKDYKVEIPESMSLRSDLARLLRSWRRNPERVAGALVGLCVPSARVEEDVADHDYRLLSYGGKAADELIEAGVTGEQLAHAGLEITKALRDVLVPVSEEAVGAKADFSEAEEEAPTSS